MTSPGHRLSHYLKMRRESSNRVMSDEERLSTSPLRLSSPSVPSRDSESGEVLGQKVVTIRRPPEEFLQRPSLSVDIPMGPNQPGPYSLLREHQRFSGFRVQDALAQRGSLRLRKGAMTYTRRPAPFPQYQMCLTTRKGAPPAAQLFRLRDLHQMYGGWGNGNLRPFFRVPRESLSGTEVSLPIRNPNRILVNVWEEFILGTSVLEKKGWKLVDEQTYIRDVVRKHLQKFLPKVVIDFFIYSVFFVLLFMSCLMYNMFWQLGGYILLQTHLRIHERAYENGIDVEFIGSVFQGPAYACVRSWCQHCIQIENNRVFNKLMKKMKTDIVTN